MTFEELQAQIEEFKAQLEYRKPKKVVINTTPSGFEFYDCPTCQNMVASSDSIHFWMKSESLKYCPTCGQMFDFSDVDWEDK